VTSWPFLSARAVKCLPVGPVAPNMVIFIVEGALVCVREDKQQHLLGCTIEFGDAPLQDTLCNHQVLDHRDSKPLDPRKINSERGRGEGYTLSHYRLHSSE